MNRKTTTSRKDFFKQAGLGFAGLFGASSVAKGASDTNQSASTRQIPNTVAPKSALARVRPVKGTVQREVL